MLLVGVEVTVVYVFVGGRGGGDCGVCVCVG